MDPAPFGVISDALKTIDEFLTNLGVNCTPLILHHPPSHRSAQAAILHQNLEILDLYEKEFSRIYERIYQIKNRFLRRRATLASALTPIAALPVELMREIFQLVINTSSSSLFPIATVCSSWRTIALNHPTLWSVIEVGVGGSLHKVATSYLRSHSSQLHLEVHDKPDNWSYQLFKSLPNVERQLQTLRWHSSNNVADFLSTEYVTFSALHTLTVGFPESCKACGTWSGDLSHMDPVLGFLDPETFPALRSLEIESLELELPVEILPQLEHLKFNSVEMDIDTYRDALRHARSLKSLVIHFTTESRQLLDQDPNPSEDTYILPNLETMELNWNRSVLVDMILKTFRFPSLVTLHVGGLTPRTFPPILHSLERALTHAPKLRDFIITKSEAEEICFLTIVVTNGSAQNGSEPSQATVGAIGSEPSAQRLSHGSQRA
ncbi:hypothetical protein DL93DRAFT_405372 [Clavulina sp. PMI_390]|nr:hypothetical protein DL93DRAFT_405372 [Clavulina sp. PMI_390]